MYSFLCLISLLLLFLVSGLFPYFLITLSSLVIAYHYWLHVVSIVKSPTLAKTILFGIYDLIVRLLVIKCFCNLSICLYLLAEVLWLHTSQPNSTPDTTRNPKRFFLVFQSHSLALLHLFYSECSAFHPPWNLFNLLALQVSQLSLLWKSRHKSLYSLATCKGLPLMMYSLHDLSLVGVHLHPNFMTNNVRAFKFSYVEHSMMECHLVFTTPWVQ